MCENCKFRANYDRKPNLNEEQKNELREKYKFTKYQ